MVETGRRGRLLLFVLTVSTHVHVLCLCRGLAFGDKVLIWRAYRLHGTALTDMKRRLREWERYLKNEHNVERKLGMA